MLKSTSDTRLATGALANVLNWLAQPTSSSRLATSFRVWRREEKDNEAASSQIDVSAKALRSCEQIEDFLWSRPGHEWLESLNPNGEDPVNQDQLVEFRKLARRWQQATSLPIEQLILTLSLDLFHDPADLALIYKLASLLGQMVNEHPDWRLPELIDELVVIAKNERSFLGFSENDRGFEPERHCGKVVISTVHKAKGLEWDRVYLMGVNDYWFPSALKDGSYRDEKWFIRDNLNLRAEMLAQFDALGSMDEYEWYEEGKATQKARFEQAAERLRLLYVAITRAKKELVITFNTGNKQNNGPALSLTALWQFQEER